MTLALTKRRLLLGAGLVVVGLVAVAVVVRVTLAGLAVGAALKAAGATETKFRVAQASPWRLAVEDIAFVVRRQPFAAKQVVLDRAHWWTPSLGRLRVGQARVELRVDELAGQPPEPANKPPGGPRRLPLDEISVDGQLVLRAPDVPDQALTLTFEAKPSGQGKWSGRTEVTAPGLVVKGEGTYDLANGDVAFKLPELSIDPRTWQGFLGRLAPTAAEIGAIEEKFSGSIEGRLTGETASVGGQVVIRAADGQDHALAVKLDATKAGADRWTGHTQVTAPGLALKGEGTYDLGTGDLAFKLPEISLDLKTWQGLLPRGGAISGDWELEGKFAGSAEGRLAGGKLTAAGKVQLRDGQGVSAAKAIAAEGIEAELEFIDLAEAVTKPGTLRIRELRTGQFTMRDLRWEFALAGTDRIDVARVSLLALGGRMSAEPFQLTPSRAELDAVLLVEDVSMEEVMALTKDLPARATGRVNGRVPVRIGADGLRFGTGWLELGSGIQAEVQFNTKGLLTAGSSPKSPTYTVMQQIESGLLKLRVNELRLDIHPPNAPEGRSARLHLRGEPLEGPKTPVTLDLNVNGPVEELLNMGLNSRLSFGAGK